MCSIYTILRAIPNFKTKDNHYMEIFIEVINADIKVYFYESYRVLFSHLNLTKITNNTDERNSRIQHSLFPPFRYNCMAKCEMGTRTISLYNLKRFWVLGVIFIKVLSKQRWWSR